MSADLVEGVEPGALDSIVTAPNPWAALGRRLEGKYSGREWVNRNPGIVMKYAARRFHFDEREPRLGEFFDGNPQKLRTLVLDKERRNFDKVKQWFDTLSDAEAELVLMLGEKGSGKTWTAGVSGWHLKRRKPSRKVYLHTIGRSVPRHGDDDYLERCVTLDEVDPGSVVIMDETGRTLNARNSGGAANRRFAKLVPIVRHFDLTLLLITQNTALTDINATRMSDALWVKKTSLNQASTERKGVGGFLEHFREMLPDAQEDNLVISSRFAPMTFRLPRPDWWLREFSKSYGGFKTDDEAIEVGLALRRAGWEIPDIAEEMGDLRFRRDPAWWLGAITKANGGIDPYTRAAPTGGDAPEAARADAAAWDPDAVKWRPRRGRA